LLYRKFHFVTTSSGAPNASLSDEVIDVRPARSIDLMLVTDILNNKPALIHRIVETGSLSTAAGLMSCSRVGALVVENALGQLTGLISEREITGAVARWGSEAHRHLVAEVMIREVPMARPSERVMDLVAIMTRHRARHVPVLDENETLVGILSIGDLLKSRLDEKIHENLILQEIARLAN
jgi:CBS-domain-containing membrane protein